MLTIDFNKIFMFFLFIICIVSVNQSYSLCFYPPQNVNKDTIIGSIQTTQVQINEDFSDIAMKFGVGYYEILEANPGIDPDDPPVNTAIVVPTQYLLPTELKKNTIVVNLAEMRLYYLPNSEDKIYIFPVGIGKEGWDTPIGERKIIEKIMHPMWKVPDSIYKFRTYLGEKIPKIVPYGPNNPLGNFALRLSQGEYLMHGTNSPRGIGRRSSAGCIRLYNQDIEVLYHNVFIGTKVIIINEPYKISVIDKNLYLEAHMPLMEQRLQMDKNMKGVIKLVMDTAKKYNLVVDRAKVMCIVNEHIGVPIKINL